MTDARERFNKLSWEILEHKYRYYILDQPIIQDHAYDMLEKEYEALATELGEPPTASDMVGFDTDRPSCRSVVFKLTQPPPKQGRKAPKKI